MNQLIPPNVQAIIDAAKAKEQRAAARGRKANGHIKPAAHKAPAMYEAGDPGPGFGQDGMYGSAEVKESSKQGRFRLIPFDHIIAGKVSEYVVKGLLPKRGLALIWGPPKCGKSFWIYDLIMHVVRGATYRGLRVHATPAVYLALEGQAGFDRRVEAWRCHHLDPGEKVSGFYLCKEPIALVADHQDLIACIRAQSVNPGVVVIDTLNRSLTGSESSDADMAAYLRAAAAVEAEFECLVIIIHHCGHNETRPRGHSSQTGAADVQISILRDDAGVSTVTLEYAKDMATDVSLSFKLLPVILGKDQDGDDFCSMVAVPADEGAKGKANKPLPTPKAKGFLDAFHNCPTVMNDGKLCVSLRDWRAECIKIGVLDPEIDDPDAKKRNNSTFSKFKGELREKGHIAINGNYVWKR